MTLAGSFGMSINEWVDQQEREALGLHRYGPPHAQEDCGCDFSGTHDRTCAEHSEEG